MPQITLEYTPANCTTSLKSYFCIGNHSTVTVVGEHTNVKIGILTVLGIFKTGVEFDTHNTRLSRRYKGHDMLQIKSVKFDSRSTIVEFTIGTTHRNYMQLSWFCVYYWATAHSTL
jgi:CII-binding regulator of phage lambda lysogenization HflD